MCCEKNNIKLLFNNFFSTAAAIGNALRAALGVRVRDLPFTRERVAAALG